MKKKNDAQILRDWGIYNPNMRKKSLRYQFPIEKGIYWYLFSLNIRQRDVKEYGTCISCNKPITVDTCDAGHFIAAAGCGRDLLFDPMNVHAECGRCNAFDENHIYSYERGLNSRYGEDLVISLKNRYFEYKNGGPVKDWKASEYADKIRALDSFQQHMKHNAEQ